MASVLSCLLFLWLLQNLYGPNFAYFIMQSYLFCVNLYNSFREYFSIKYFYLFLGYLAIDFFCFIC